MWFKDYLRLYFQGRIVPLKGQITAHTLGKTMSATQSLAISAAAPTSSTESTQI
jgi:hypothetical protein